MGSMRDQVVRRPTLVHRRITWDPTPIPHLPMTLHVNTWPIRSRELAGRLALRALPASAIVRRVAVDTYIADARAHSQLRPPLATPVVHPKADRVAPADIAGRWSV